MLNFNKTVKKNRAADFKKSFRKENISVFKMVVDSIVKEILLLFLETFEVLQFLLLSHCLMQNYLWKETNSLLLKFCASRWDQIDLFYNSFNYRWFHALHCVKQKTENKHDTLLTTELTFKISKRREFRLL